MRLALLRFTNKVTFSVWFISLDAGFKNKMKIDMYVQSRKIIYDATSHQCKIALVCSLCNQFISIQKDDIK